MTRRNVLLYWIEETDAQEFLKVALMEGLPSHRNITIIPRKPKVIWQSRALNICLARRHDLTHTPLNPSFSHAYSRIGLAKLELGESVAAFEPVLKAQRLSPRECRASLCHLYLGIASRHLNAMTKPRS